MQKVKSENVYLKNVFPIKHRTMYLCILKHNIKLTSV